MAVLANTRHERFAQELAKGSTASAAYVEAGYKASDANCSRLTGNDRIKARVAELQGRAAARAEISIASVTEALLRIAEKGEKLREAAGLSVARAAHMDAAKLNGLVVDRSLTATASLEELLDRLPPAGGAGSPED